MTKAEYKAHIIANSNFANELFNDFYEILPNGDGWRVESRLGDIPKYLKSLSCCLCGGKDCNCDSP